jgi:hypothetical protein
MQAAPVNHAHAGKAGPNRFQQEFFEDETGLLQIQTMQIDVRL